MMLNPNDPSNDPLAQQSQMSLGAQPHLGICDYGGQAIAEARNPSITFVQMTQIRARLACPGCVQAFDLELKVKTTLATAAVEAPPVGMQTRISAALERMDLSQLDVTDL